MRVSDSLLYHHVLRRMLQPLAYLPLCGRSKPFVLWINAGVKSSHIALSAAGNTEQIYLYTRLAATLTSFLPVKALQ